MTDPPCTDHLSAMPIRPRPVARPSALASFLALFVVGCGGDEPAPPPVAGPATEVHRAPSPAAPPTPVEPAPSDPTTGKGADAPLVHPPAEVPPAEAEGPLHPLFPEGVEPVEAMYAAVDRVMARPEHGDSIVKVQHILVGVGPEYGGRMPAEAEKRAAMILRELAEAEGAGFAKLVEEHSNDLPPGIYTMQSSGVVDPTKEIYPRARMIQAFGDVAWRLRVGEVEVAPNDPNPPMGQGTSKYGIHIIKRLE